MNDRKYSHRPYEAVFPALYQTEAERLEAVLGNQVVVEHFGSTAVPGLGGKGIIDIFAKAPRTELGRMADLVKELGYEHRVGGDRDGRTFFRLNKPDAEGRQRTYHLHLTDDQNPNFEHSIIMRDYLREHPEEAQRYDELKRKAAQAAQEHNLYEAQKKTYQEAKTDYLDNLREQSWNWWKTKGT